MVHPPRLPQARDPLEDVGPINTAKIRRLATGKLTEVLKRLESVMEQARLEWNEERERFQAAEKAFLAWRFAVKAAALLALSASGEPLSLLRDIDRVTQGRVQLSEFSLYVTTSTAPWLARLLASSERVHPDVRRVAQQLRQAKDSAYKLHAFFYEGDPGAAGFESFNELENTFNPTLQVVDKAAKTIAASVARLLSRSRASSREALPA